MGEERALTTQAKAQSIRSLFNDNRVKSEIMKALPRHMNADKLIRVAMTSIQRNPKLMDCSRQSLLGCIMTCAALGLEPDQFLGQAYLVPFWNEKKKCNEAQLIPGYRGYIALARRTGEVQSVSAQVVYQADRFDLQYGINEKLEHVPAEGDRGEVRGAYVIFRYKDGAYSFDYMPKSDIDAIRKRSKSAESGPWVTDYGEMAKKTVIKRHSKLVPLSVEFQKAVALEDRSNTGETQMDLLTEDAPGMLLDAPAEDHPDLTEAVRDFDEKTKGWGKNLKQYLKVCATFFKTSDDEVKAGAVKDWANFEANFNKWAMLQAQKKTEVKEKVKEPAFTAEEMARGSCPNEPSITYTKKHCDDCENREGCPVWG